MGIRIYIPFAPSHENHPRKTLLSINVKAKLEIYKFQATAERVSEEKYKSQD